MYAVSNDFKTKMKDPQRVEHIRGTVDDVLFTDANIMSLSYSNRCSDTKDVTFGSAYIGELDVSFCEIEIARGYWFGKVITLEYGLELDDEHTTEWIPVGVFKIAKAEWTDTGVSVTAYDCLADLDSQAQITSTVGKPYDILNLISTLSGVNIGRSSADIQILPNGDKTMRLVEPNDIATYRDMTSWLSQSVGGFATSDRGGNLIIKSFAESAIVDRILARNRVIGSVFSDFSTKYEGVSVTDFDSGSTYYYAGQGSDGGATIALGANPFLQYGNKDELRQTIANVAVGIAYTPMQITLLNCPVYDLGDLIECKGGVAGDTLIGCVMAIEWQFKNTISLQGYGADPNLSSGKTKAEKALNSLSKQAKSDSITYHRISPAHDITIDTTNTVLYEIDFAVGDTTEINIWHELIELNSFTDETQSVQLFYYYDDELLSYSPIDTYSESGKYHTQKGDYWLLNVTSGTVHNWRVEARTDNGTAFIKTGDLKATLWGQKVVGVNDSGNIEITDFYDLQALGTPRPIGLLEGEVYLGPPTPTGNYLELESGGYLELESGGYLELEGGS